MLPIPGSGPRFFKEMDKEIVEKIQEQYYKSELPKIHKLLQEFKQEMGQTGRAMRINYLDEQIQTVNHNLLRCHTSCTDNTLSKETKEFATQSIALLTEERIKLKKEKKMVLSFKGHASRNQVTPDMIAQAKLYPVESLLPQNKKGFLPCIFHSEKTASMKINKYKNFAYCHGCHESADSIKIFMHLNNVSFLDAVRNLQ